MYKATSNVHNNNHPKVKLYDSGASCHMSPYQHQFTTYHPIPPCPIYITDQWQFFAIGTGDVKIDVPNEDKITSITLSDTLHASDIGLTIISINCIANSGHSVLFEGSHCKIKNLKGQIISNIPANASGLYKVKHAHSAQIQLDSVNLPTLHRKLGHISVDSICALIHDHIILGIQLINTPSLIVCEFCKHAKATHKPRSKEHSAPLVKTFGAKIHSDI